MNELVSVIVPVFNGAETVQSCLQSILSCGYAGLELIVVDDGSTDATAEICARMAALDRRIVYLRQENRGVSAARNAGLRRSRGAYVTFVDADDLLAPGILFQAVRRMTPGGLVCWNCSRLYGTRTVPEPPFPEASPDILTLYAWVIGGVRPRYFRACWGKLYDGAILRTLCFDETLSIGEDAVLLLDYLKRIKSVVLLPDCGYLYRRTAHSAVHRRNPVLEAQAFLQKRRIGEFLSAEKLDTPAIRTAMTALCWQIYGNLLENGSKPRRWLTENASALWDEQADPAGLPRLCRLQRRCPMLLLKPLTLAARKRRERKLKGLIHNE